MKHTFITSILNGSTLSDSTRVEGISEPTQYESPIKRYRPTLSGTAALICSLVMMIALAGVAFFGGPAGAAYAESQPNQVAAAPDFGTQQVNEYIVVFKEDQVGSDNNGLSINDYATTLVSIYDGTLLYTYEQTLAGFAAELTAEAAAEIATLDDVEEVVENIEISIDVAPLLDGDGNQTSATWGIDRVDQKDLPLDSTYTYSNEAESVHVYIIDTGIRASHDEFGGRVGQGHSSINDSNGTNDCNGHGTHVAGTVGGTQYGIAKKAKLYPIRVLNCSGSGSLAGVLAGIEWVTANHTKPAVANVSLGGSANATFDRAIKKSVDAGVTYVVSAGNNRGNACLKSPARADEAITVGATTNSDARAIFSNYGTCVDIFAPGEDITAAWNNSDSGTRTIDGTSMASPHVAGAAALHLQANPNHTPAEVFQALLGRATKDKLSEIGTGSPNLLLYTLGNTPPPGATLYIDGSPLTMGVGETKTLSIKLSAGGVEVNGAQINGKVDPRYLKIVDVQSNTSKLASILDPIQFDANAGTFRYGAGTLSGVVNGDFEVLQVQVEALAETNSTAIEFLSSFPATNISGPSGSVLDEARNGEVKIDVGTTPGLQFEVKLQSRPEEADASKVIPLKVEFFQPGGSSPIKSIDVTTDQDARFAVDGIGAGTYDVRMSGSNTLVSRVKNVVVGSGTTRAFLGPLMAGDIIQDNKIVLEDFGPFSAGFNNRKGRSGFDERTDLNNDGYTNIKDFALISGNFNKQGDLEYPFDNAPILPLSLPSARINLGSTNLDVTVGESFEVPVWIDPNGGRVNGVTVNLSFDPSLIEIVSVDLSDTALPMILQAPTIDASNGRVAFSVGSQSTTQSSAFQVATLTVRVKDKTGSTTLTFDRNEIDGTDITGEQGSIFDSLAGLEITAGCLESAQGTEDGDIVIDFGTIDSGTDVMPDSCENAVDPPKTTKLFLPIVVR